MDLGTSNVSHGLPGTSSKTSLESESKTRGNCRDYVPRYSLVRNPQPWEYDEIERERLWLVVERDLAPMKAAVVSALARV